MKWKNLQLPRRIQLLEEESNERYGRFIIEPLERGFGDTIGNALRRVLLSSLQGAAVSAIRIDGALHEFTTLPGVLEDTSEIILNLKRIRFKHHGDGERKGVFKIKGEATVTAGDMEVPPDIEILNPDQHVATLNNEGELIMEVEIVPGRGYVSADQQDTSLDRPIGVIAVDSLFSPVSKVNFDVEKTRIGQRIDYDKLTMDVWTDGSILPQDAMSLGAKILRDHFALFINFEEDFIEEPTDDVDEDKARLRTLLNRSVDELELSVRSGNCLRAAKVRTIGDLVQKNEQEMLKQRNFGRKSLKEIEDILSEMNLRLGMDVSDILGTSGTSEDDEEAPDSVFDSMSAMDAEPMMDEDDDESTPTDDDDEIVESEEGAEVPQTD